MKSDLQLNELFKKGAELVQKERSEEEMKRKAELEKQKQAFQQLWIEVGKEIPTAFKKFVTASDEDIRDLLFDGRSHGFHCDFPQSLPIYLDIDIRNGIIVEYLIPAIIKSEDGFRYGFSIATRESVWHELHIIQTDDPARAVFLANERYLLLTHANSAIGIQKKEPEYEPIEKTQMVNPSLDDLINLRIEQALKAALA